MIEEKELQKQQIQDEYSHDLQKIFLQLHNSEIGERLQHMNQQEDDSCWSESQKQENHKEIDDDVSFGEYEKKQELENYDIDKLEQFQKRSNKNIHTISSKQIRLGDESIDNKTCKTGKTNFNSQRFSNYLDQNDSTIHFKNDEKYSNKDHVSQSKSNRLLLKLMSNKLESCSSKQITEKEIGLVRNRSTIYQDTYKVFQNKHKAFYQKLKSRMVYYFKNFTLIGKTQQLNQLVRKQVQDLSDYIPKEKSSNLLTFLKSFCLIRRFLKKIPVINTESYMGFIIKIIYTVFDICFLFFFSLVIVFQGYQSYQELSSVIVKSIWILEITLKLNTSTFENSKIIQKRNKILLLYLKEQAFFDIFPIIMISIPHFDLFSQLIFQILVFLKIPNIIKEVNDIQRQLCMMVKRYYIIQLFNLIVKLFLIAHIIACLWYLLALIEINYLLEEKTWFDYSLDTDRTWWKLYISALYWALTLMTTGSNTATTILQTFFTTFIMLFTTIAFGYLLNVIGLILSEMDEKDENKRRDINIINEYMRKKDISKILQSKVNLNLEYYYQQNQKKIQEDNAQVLDKISIELKNQLLKEYNRQIINKIDVLKQKFSSETLDELSLTLQEEYYFPNQIISDFNDPNKTSLIYIIQGEVEHLFNKRKNKYIKNNNLQFSGQVFGIENFFTGISEDVCTKSREFTKIIKFERQKFIDIIKDKDKDFQIFCQTKDKILFYSTYKDIKNKCICNQYSHTIKDCQYLHLNKNYTLQKVCYGLTLQQKRQVFKRNKSQKYKTILNTYTIQRHALQFIQNVKITGNMKSMLMDMYFKDTNSSLDSENNSNFYQSQQQISEKQSEYRSKRESVKNISRAEIERAQSFDGFRKTMRQQQYGNQEFEDHDYQKGSSKEIEFNPFSSQKLQSELKLSRKENIESSKNIKKDFSEFQAHSHSEFVEKKFTASIGTSLENKQQEEMEESMKNYRQKSKESSFKLQFIHQPKSLEDFKKFIKQYSKSNYLSVNTSDQRDMFTKKYSTILYTKNMLDEDFELQLYNPWYFEQLKDFKYYFPSGNSYNILKRYMRKRRKTRIPTKRQKTKVW